MRNIVCEVFEELSLHYSILRESEEAIVYNLGVSLINGKIDCFIDIRDEDGVLLMYFRCPMNTPPNRRNAIAEYITMANFNLKIGNFEMDFNDGEIRFKSSLLFVAHNLPSTEIIGQNLVNGFRMMDRYLPGIMAIVYGGLDPKTACAQAEDRENPALN